MLSDGNHNDDDDGNSKNKMSESIIPSSEWCHYWAVIVVSDNDSSWSTSNAIHEQEVENRQSTVTFVSRRFSLFCAKACVRLNRFFVFSMIV